MAYAIKCAITGYFLKSVSIPSQSLALTKKRADALTVELLGTARELRDQISAPNQWPDFDWKVGEV